MPIHPSEDDLHAVLAKAAGFAREYLESLNSRAPAIEPKPFDPQPLAEGGAGAAASIESIWTDFGSQFSGNPGPRYWAFVSGGVTPAALAGDWLTSALDQNVQDFHDGAAVNLELEALDLLRQLFELPLEFRGSLVSGGTMANFVGVAVGVQVLGQHRGIDVSQQGVAALPDLRILSGEAHASIGKVAAMAGIGRSKVESIRRQPGREAVDISALRDRINHLRDSSIIIVANAGTVTTGDFDNLHAIGQLAKEAGAYLHVDGAFGLFARLSASHQQLLAGLELADSIASDGHKLLNVPQDAGFVFTRHPTAQLEVFKSVSNYLPAPSANSNSAQHLAPETSRRMRGLPILTSLRAYGRSGHAEIVQGCTKLAREMGDRIARLPGFRLMAPVRFNVVCFELIDSEGVPEEQAIGAFCERVRVGGRLFVSPSRFLGRACIRFAIVNWRTTPNDLDVATETLRECRGLSVCLTNASEGKAVLAHESKGARGSHYEDR